MTATTDGAVRRLTAVVALQLALFVALGLPDGALGVAWPAMRDSVGRPLGDLGVVLASSTLGYLAGSTTMARVVRRAGTGRAMALAATVATLAVAIWAATSTWPMLLAAGFVLGTTRGVTDAGLNTHVALHGGVRRMGLLHAAYGVGTTVAPLLVVAGDAVTGSWRSAWLALAAVHGVLAVWAWQLVPAWPAEPEHDEARRRADGPVPVGTVVLTLATFAALVAAEYTPGAWSYTLLTESRGMGDAAAGVWVATYWGGLTAGRFAMALWGHRVAPSHLLRAGCLLGLAGLGWLAADPLGLGPLGLPVAGLGYASVFPVLVLLTPERIGVSRSPTVIGWAAAVANLAGVAAAWTMGLLAEDDPGVLAPAFVLAAAVLVLLEIVLAASVRRPVAAP